jgi:uncharacterized membrane protein
MIDVMNNILFGFSWLFGYLLAFMVFIFFIMLAYVVFITITMLIGEKGLEKERSSRMDILEKYGEGGSPEELTREEPVAKTSEILKRAWKKEE